MIGKVGRLVDAGAAGSAEKPVKDWRPGGRPQCGKGVKGPVTINGKRLVWFYLGLTLAKATMSSTSRIFLGAPLAAALIIASPTSCKVQKPFG